MRSYGRTILAFATSVLLFACGSNNSQANDQAISPSGNALPKKEEPAFAAHVFAHGAARLCYRVAGSGPTLIMLAGGPGLSTAYIEPLGRHLAQTNTVVLFDQRGTGCSSVSPADARTLTLASDRDDLEALRHELGHPTLRLFGHSWGAMLAMAYACRYPSRLSLLVLSDSGGPDLAFADAFGKRIVKARRPEEARALRTLSESSPQFWRVYFMAYMYDRAKIGLALGDVAASHYFDPTMATLMSADVGKNYHLRSCLGAIRAPTLIVQGIADPMGADTAADLQRLIPGAALHLIERAGHFPWAENPDDYYAIVAAFLTEHTAEVSARAQHRGL